MAKKKKELEEELTQPEREIEIEEVDEEGEIVTKTKIIPSSKEIKQRHQEKLRKQFGGRRATRKRRSEYKKVIKQRQYRRGKKQYDIDDLRTRMNFIVRLRRKKDNYVEQFAGGAGINGVQSFSKIGKLTEPISLKQVKRIVNEKLNSGEYSLDLSQGTYSIYNRGSKRVIIHESFQPHKVWIR